MEYILGFLFILFLYKLITPSRKTYKEEYKALKISDFDSYLIERHKESQERVDKMLVPSSVNDTQHQDKSWTDNLYLGMIASEQCDTNALRKEAMEVMSITENELDKLLENYKLDNKCK